MPKFLLAGPPVLVLACPAAGATRRHGSDPRDAEIAALRAEVDALRQRLDADEAAQRTTALQAETAEQSAAAGGGGAVRGARAEASHERVDTSAEGAGRRRHAGPAAGEDAWARLVGN